VGFKANRKSKSLAKSIVIALRHTDRVCEIDLGLTTRTIQSIVDVMQVPFPVLERIRIWPKDTVEPVVIREFLGGSAPCLKEVYVDSIGIPFLALRRLLLSTDNLVELVLKKILKSCYFSPDAFATALSGLNHLEKLEISFLPPASRSTTNMESLPPLERSTCPSITSLTFYAASEFVESFVARTHMPALTNLEIRLFNQLILEIPQLYGFIYRVGHGSFYHLGMAQFEDSVSIRFYPKKRGHGLDHCGLIIPCRQLDWQLSFITEILNQIPNLISNAKLFKIYNFAMPAGREDVDPAQWLELFQPLSHISEVYVETERLVLDVVHALINEDIAAGVLPGLAKLYLKGYRNSPPAVDAAERFVAIRKLASRNILLSG
jgi:hypothetical protein